MAEADDIAAELAARGYRVAAPAPAAGAAPAPASFDAQANALAAEQPSVAAPAGAFDQRGAPRRPVDVVGDLAPSDVARELVRRRVMTSGQATEAFGFPVQDPDLEKLRLEAAGGDMGAIDQLSHREGGIYPTPGMASRTLGYLRDNAAPLALGAGVSFLKHAPAAALASGTVMAGTELYRMAREDPDGTLRALSGNDTPGLKTLGERLGLQFAAGVGGEFGGRAAGLGFSAGLRSMMSPQALEAERVLGETMAQPNVVARPIERIGSEVATAATGGAIAPLREPPFALTRLFPGLAPIETVLNKTMFSSGMFEAVRQRAAEAANRLRIGYLEPAPDVGPLHELVGSEAHMAGVTVPTGAINALGQRYRSIIAPGGGDTALADRLANASTTRVAFNDFGNPQLVRSPSLDFDAAKRLRTDLMDQARGSYRNGLDTAGGELVHAADVVDNSIADGLRLADPSGRLYTQWREANAGTRLGYQRQMMGDLIEKHTSAPDIVGQGPQLNGGALADELRRRGNELERAFGADHYRDMVDYADAVNFSQQGAPRGPQRYSILPYAQVLVASYMVRDSIVASLYGEPQAPSLSGLAAAGAVFLAPALVSRALTNPGLAKALIAVARNPDNTAKTAAAVGKLALGGAAMAYEDDQNARRASTLPPPSLAPILAAPNSPAGGAAPASTSPGVQGRGPLPVPFPQPTPSRGPVMPGPTAPTNLPSPTAP